MFSLITHLLQIISEAIRAYQEAKTKKEMEREHAVKQRERIVDGLEARLSQRNDIQRYPERLRADDGHRTD